MALTRSLNFNDFTRAALILVLVSVLGQYCCFHEVLESAVILLQIPIPKKKKFFSHARIK